MKIAPIALLILGICASSCKVSKDPTPDAHPNAKTYTSVINTTNMGNSAAANIVDSVKVGDEVAKLRLEVTGVVPAKYIYIVHNGDNGTMIPLSVPTTTNEYGTFTGGSSAYSLKVPDLASFTIDIYVTVKALN